MRRISTRLAVSFLIVALLPTLPLSLVVRSLLERRFGPVISEPLELALESGLTESRGRLGDRTTGLKRLADRMALDNGHLEFLLLDEWGTDQPDSAKDVFLKNHPQFMDQIQQLPMPAKSTATPVQRLETILASRIMTPDGHLILLAQPLPNGMVLRAGHMTSGMSLLRVVASDENRVVLSFVGPFLVVYGLLIIVALALGLLWSRQMVGPLETLVTATRRVAAGDLQFRLKKQGPGEVGELVESFDTMISRLTVQRRDLARLERVSAWRGMARTLAHEVKNPLTPILLAVNQARDTYSGDDPAYGALLQEVAEIVGEEVETLRSLVREFGDFARLPKCELLPGDMGDLLRDLSKLYGQENLQIIGEDLAGSAVFDSSALRRALINLIDNGMAACREAGKPTLVELEFLDRGSEMRLAIRDAGVGISGENQARIFEPDFTTKSGGMGLGLAIVENIVLGHGGSIAVKSDLGYGTTFTIDLPALIPGTEQQEESS